MEINETNFISKLTNTVNELVIVIAQFNEIDQDNINNHQKILELNGRFVIAIEPLTDIINFIVQNKPSPATVGTKLSDAIRYMGEVLKEKTRILENTPQIFKETNDMSALN